MERFGVQLWMGNERRLWWWFCLFHKKKMLLLNLSCKIIHREKEIVTFTKMYLDISISLTMHLSL